MIGGVRAGQLLSRFGDPQGGYEAGTAGWREILSDSVVEYMDRQKKSGNLEEEYHSLGEKQIGLVLQEEEGFPQKLLEIPDPPYGLFYKGKLPEQKQPSVAVIGARECSEYGRFVAEELGRYLGSQGIQVISGMARGIDGISQQAALLAGGTSYGVLGCGVDICYPRQNRKLYEELIQKGGLLSTYAPGTKALPAYFPLFRFYGTQQNSAKLQRCSDCCSFMMLHQSIFRRASRTLLAQISRSFLVIRPFSSASIRRSV